MHCRRNRDSKLDHLPSVCDGAERGARSGDRRDRSHRRSRDGLAVVHVDVRLQLAVGGGILAAVTRDVAGLAARVARLAGGVERPAVGGGAVARDMAELAAGIALHRLRLAVASEVVWATALVAGGRARAAGEAAAHRRKTTAADDGASSKSGNGGIGAVALEGRGQSAWENRGIRGEEW